MWVILRIILIDSLRLAKHKLRAIQFLAVIQRREVKAWLVVDSWWYRVEEDVDGSSVLI